MAYRRLLIYGTVLLSAYAAFGKAEGYKFFNPSIADSIPKRISGTGFYEDILAKKISADVVPFDVNSPLWTDGAIKQRYIAVPPGAKVIYDDTADTYAYPDRAMVIKNFSLDTIPGNPASRILIETRFTGVKKVAGKDKWFLWAYRWRLDQSDAELVTDTGANALVRIYDKGAGQAPRLKKWRYPDKVQCAACHRVAGTGGRTVLAFFTAQLNRPMAADPAFNQIQHFFDIGLLAMPAGIAKPDFSKSPRWARWDDATASLELRARSYIAANCSGCHGTRGIGTQAANTITIDYDYHDMKPHMDLAAKKLVGVFPIDSAGLIVPGRPDRSVLLYRQQARNQKDQDFTAERDAMPPLGSFEPDTNAIKVVSTWITSLGSAGIAYGHAGQGAARGILARNGRLILPEGMATGTGRLSIVDVRGATRFLERAQDGSYPYGRQVTGIHLVVWNGKVLGRAAL